MIIKHSSEINEIYFNKFDMYNPQSHGIGTIKIYRKKEFFNYKADNKKNTFKVSNGFQEKNTYKNPYLSRFSHPSFI